jgi:hypothetical protein
MTKDLLQQLYAARVECKEAWEVYNSCPLPRIDAVELRAQAASRELDRLQGRYDIEVVVEAIETGRRVEFRRQERESHLVTAHFPYTGDTLVVLRLDLREAVEAKATASSRTIWGTLLASPLLVEEAAFALVESQPEIQHQQC